MSSSTQHSAQWIDCLLCSKPLRILAQKFGQADDSVQGCAQLVTHIGEEARLRPASFHCLVPSDFELADRLRELILTLLQRSDVRPGGNCSTLLGGMFPSACPSSVFKLLLMHTRRISVKRDTPLEPGLEVADGVVIVSAVQSEANHVLKSNTGHQQIVEANHLMELAIAHHQPILFIPQRKPARHALDCIGDTCPPLLHQGLRLFESLFASGYVTPRTDHFDWSATLVAYQMPFITYPAIAAIFLEKSILDGVMTYFVEMDGLGFYPGEVVWMNAATP